MRFFAGARNLSTREGIRLRLFVDATKKTKGSRNMTKRQAAITSQDENTLR
ncbi:MAG: hypothetical protein ABSB63_02910 [Spirochaetia bacterium]